MNRPPTRTRLARKARSEGIDSRSCRKNLAMIWTQASRTKRQKTRTVAARQEMRFIRVKDDQGAFASNSC